MASLGADSSFQKLSSKFQRDMVTGFMAGSMERCRSIEMDRYLNR